LCEPPGPVTNVVTPTPSTSSRAEPAETTETGVKRSASSFNFGFGSFGQRGRRDEASPKSMASTQEPCMPFRVTEVSALTNSGIDTLFLEASQALAKRTVALAFEQQRRDRESIMLHDDTAPVGHPPASGSWGCC
jgi:hypothetical protein